MIRLDESRLTLNVQIRIKIVPFVIDNNKSGEVFDFDFPHGLHPEVFVFEDVHFFNAMFGESCGVPAFLTSRFPTRIKKGESMRKLLKGQLISSWT